MRKYILITLSLFLFLNTYSQKDTLTIKKRPLLIINPSFYSGYLGLGIEQPIKKHLNYFLNVNSYFMFHQLTNALNAGDYNEANGFSVKTGVKYYFNCKNTNYNDGYFISPLFIYKQISSEDIYKELYGLELLVGSLDYHSFPVNSGVVSNWLLGWYCGVGFRSAYKKTTRIRISSGTTNKIEYQYYPTIHLGFVLGLDFNKYQ